MAHTPEERRAADRARYAENPEKKKTRSRAWIAAHPEEHRAHNKAYREAHPDQVKAAKAAYAKANPEKMRAAQERFKTAHSEETPKKAKAYREMDIEKSRTRSRVYYVTHRAERRTYLKAWHAANPDAKAAIDARHRARKSRSETNDLTAAQWRAIKQAFHNRCAYCGKQSQRLTQDHITPVSKGGAHSLHNVIPACQSCNSRKNVGPPLCAVQPLLLTIPSSKTKDGQ